MMQEDAHMETYGCIQNQTLTYGSVLRSWPERMLALVHTEADLAERLLDGVLTVSEQKAGAADARGVLVHRLGRDGAAQEHRVSARRSTSS